MEEKATKTLSILAILISFATLMYTVVVTEVGVLIGADDYELTVKDRLEIVNTSGALLLKQELLIRNDGTKPLRINKVAALLQLGGNYHIFESSFVINVLPQNVWSGTIFLNEHLTDGETIVRDQLSVDITKQSVEGYRLNKDKNKPVFLSSDLLERVGDVLKSNTTWMDQDKNYRLLLLLWVNEDTNSPAERRLFKFEFSSWQKKIITEVQNDSYLTPRDDLLTANLFVSYAARVKLSKDDDASQLALAFREYEKLATE